MVDAEHADAARREAMCMAGRGAAEATSAGPARARSFGGTPQPTSRAWAEDAGAEAVPLPASPPHGRGHALL
jgi:hypothetical protein